MLVYNFYSTHLIIIIVFSTRQIRRDLKRRKNIPENIVQTGCLVVKEMKGASRKFGSDYLWRMIRNKYNVIVKRWLLFNSCHKDVNIVFVNKQLICFVKPHPLKLLYK